MGEDEGVIWVKSSADIPRNDFLNFSPQELKARYPKIPLEDLLLQRHIFFPRKFSLPPQVDKATLKYRQNLILKGPSDLKDSIFLDMPVEDINRQFPQFSPEDIAGEKAVREVRQLMKKITGSLKSRDLNTKDNVLADISKARRSLANASSSSEEMVKAMQWILQIEENVNRW
ncbi:MAG: hypothetical protein V1875_08710 [Candidatus Altiarchaeota archaeon]